MRKDQERVGGAHLSNTRPLPILRKPARRRAFGRAGKPKSFLATTIARTGLVVLISVGAVFTVAQAGNLSPSAIPGATMRSLLDLWNVLAGTHDASSVSPNASGNILEQLKFIQQNLGGYTYGSASAGDVLTGAGGTYNAANLIPANVRSGMAFGVDQVGTYGGGGWTYGSDDMAKVLTSAEAPGTYDASNLSTSTVKSGVAFGVGQVGEYSASSEPLSGDTEAADATAGNICAGYEAWNKTASLLTGTMTVSADYILGGKTYCGTAGTLLANLFNGTSGSFTGGTQANGGADDYNNGGSPASGRYAKGWTACDAGNNYCNTGDSGADAKDNSTGLIWSLPCNGVDCASFSDDTPAVYTWNSSGTNNNSHTAAQVCSRHSGWYMPHQKQLMQAYIDGAYGNLETGISRNYWSATTVSGGTVNAWNTSLSYGFTHDNSKADYFYLRCVRPAN